MRNRLLAIPVAALTLALLLVLAPQRALAEPTDLAIIACENLAPYVDGDGNDATTAADFQATCVEALPQTGPNGITAVELALGDGNGVLTFEEIADLSYLDHNRIEASCTYETVIVQQTKPAAGCTLLVFFFVDDEKPVTLDTPAQITSIEAGGLAADVICSTDPPDDPDCSDVPDGNGDGLVTFRLLNASASDGAQLNIFVQQEAIEFSQAIQISSATRNDAQGPLDPDNDGVLTDEGDNCWLVSNPDQLNTDNQQIVTSGVGPADTTIANSDGAGNVCDNDDDNDGRNDFLEEMGFVCSGHQSSTVLLDTDGDRFADGAECQFGDDPNDAGSFPASPGPGEDADGDRLGDGAEGVFGFNPNDPDSHDDGIPDGVEFFGYNTSPLTGDTDGDSCPDGLEIASVDPNQVVNSIDLLIVAINFGALDKPNLDIDKNRAINSLDLLTVALRFDDVCGGID